MAEFEKTVTEARRLLAGGMAPGEVFVRLVDLADCLETVVAICVAVGIPRAKAEERLASEEKPFPIEQDEVAFFGNYFEKCGFFDIHVEYEGEQRRIADLVDTPEYWLVDAAELLGPDENDEYLDAVRRCRERAGERS